MQNQNGQNDFIFKNIYLEDNDDYLFKRKPKKRSTINDFGISYPRYLEKTKEDIKKNYKLYKNVEFSKTNHYVRINGVCYNGISKEEFKKIIKEDAK